MNDLISRAAVLEVIEAVKNLTWSQSGKVLCGKMYSQIKDIPAVYKANEPRVMIWQDVIGAVIQCKPIYIEMKDIDYEEPGGNRWAMMTQHEDSLTNGMICAMSSYITKETLFKDWYNKTWRCWTSRPTDEQREKAKWE
jgi:hypothetical protein